jgi:hypothetical protein
MLSVCLCSPLNLFVSYAVRFVSKESVLLVLPRTSYYILIAGVIVVRSFVITSCRLYIAESVRVEITNTCRNLLVNCVISTLY